ncbi:hypothetical protein P152DRAFT_460385 [Eremomyces bilateralis CBS 781.70]|uniref:Uncharacterized protein n=1 Tax=Eremomyces bilateralis CBS 781.70 TaxID=1392243 RepID=A0A6G1FYR2_9PEZI|nr:uncharacterized protein P152DRAFT_460385 [Eremomyces bilateralis CBS 781.70]KAF1810699.1 hypothetical protein P152DRAFT_460385 [Eremomyces bilateralis CBS 781.70]
MVADNPINNSKYAWTKPMALHLSNRNPSLHDDGMTNESGQASPRSRVAAQLAGLNLAIGLPIYSPMSDVTLPSPDQTPPKGSNEEMGGSSHNLNGNSAESSISPSAPPALLRERLDALDGIKMKRKTPSPDPSDPPTPTSMEPSQDPKQKHVAFALSDTFSTAETFHSPPSPTPAPLSLTWQDFEITGHLATDPDDDGTGINGVGFKPTAQIEAERQRKRQEQLERYRARMAREERERRYERRRAMRVGKSRNQSRNSSPLKTHAALRGASKFAV